MARRTRLPNQQDSVELAPSLALLADIQQRIADSRTGFDEKITLLTQALALIENLQRQLKTPKTMVVEELSGDGTLKSFV